MPNPSVTVPNVRPAPQRLVVDGYVSTVQPAPTSFSDPLYVIVPEMSGDVPLGPCEWMEGHGTALPARGAKVVVVFDEREVPVIVWWEGQYVEPTLKPALVSILPSTPTDGQEVYFQNTAMGEKGIVWHLRFRTASAEHKWEFVGGPAMSKGPEGSVEFALKEEKALAGGPSLTVPLAGEYEVRLSLYAQLREAATTEPLGFLRKGGTASGVPLFRFAASSTFALTRQTNAAIVTLAASDVLTIGCKLEQAQKVTFAEGQLAIIPVRVG